MKYGDKLYMYTTVGRHHYDGDKYYKSAYCFRMDPVPGRTHNRFAGYSNSRQPKTTQEKRQYYSCAREYTRGKRRPMMLPCSWESRTKSSYYERSWKRTKSKQKQWM